jgi:pyruvate,water dikinase
MKYIKWLHRGPLSREQVGGKAASLAEMTAAGFPVPPGFAITADGYRHFEIEAGISGKLATLTAGLNPHDAGGLRAASVAAEALAAGATLPQDLRDQIDTAFTELVSITGVAAVVRSYAVSEDGAAASFAGLYESYLNVLGIRDILESVHRCYVSLWSERALRYRAVQSMSNDAMAVVVMALVPSDASGIAFTAHPVTGDRDQVVINASWGLGEAIVSGLVTPDSFVLAKDTFAISERQISEKTIAIFPHPDGGGTIERTLTSEQASSPSISDGLAVEVARLAAAVERHYGAPQDIEWGMHDGHLFLLQARPITTL